MIVLFTDFGADDIYVGQLKASLLEHLPAGTSIVDLLHSAPGFQVRPSAHLLDALQRRFGAGTVFLAVVDPGVGSAREAVVLQTEGKWFVGPDNGLLSVVSGRALRSKTWRITWRPRLLSASFHARDLFAPIAASIAAGEFPAAKVEETENLQLRLPVEDLPEIIYIDHYGNAVTGLPARTVSHASMIGVGERQLPYAKVFGDVPQGSTFWYENSIGLVELAANRASAAARLALALGDPIRVVEPADKTT